MVTMMTTKSAEEWRAENRSPPVVIVTIIATTLSTTLMIFRFISRRMASSSFSAWDLSNAVLLLGYGGALMTSICGILATTKGFGRHLAFVAGHGTLEELLLINFIAEQSYLVGITAIKISILLFYRRIFTLKKHVIAIYVCMGMAVTWLLVFEVTCLTTCHPINLWWKNLLACKNPHADFVASAATNSAIDFAILSIPIWVISQLGLKKTQKLSAAGLFCTGGLVIFASIGRMVALIQTSMIDITYGYVPAATWSIAEINLAVVSACLPFLQPLTLRVWGGVKSQITSRSRRSSMGLNFRCSYPPDPYPPPYRNSNEKCSSDGDRESRDDDMRRICPSEGESFTVVEGNADHSYTPPLQDPEAAYIKVETSVSMEIERSSQAWQGKWERWDKV